MPKEAAGARKRGKKGPKTAGGRKKAAKKAKKVIKAKAVAARGKTMKSGAVRIPNAIGLKSQHLDFLTLRIDQVKKFYVDVLGFQFFRHICQTIYLLNFLKLWQFFGSIIFFKGVVYEFLE